jgi:hypothetical protein
VATADSRAAATEKEVRMVMAWIYSRFGFLVLSEGVIDSE